MPKKVIKITSAPPANASYSLALQAGDFIYVASRTPRDAQGRIVGTDVAVQTCHVLGQIEQILADAGATLEDLVKTNVHLSDMKHFEAYDAAYAEIVPSPRPVRTTAACLLDEGVHVEIDAVAYVGK
jgi:2-iminobutanoate/2-iminopropanoate deaminase